MNSLEAFEYVERHFDRSTIYLNLTLNNALEEIRADLQKLTEIEEELGIDLITLFKALKNGVYYTKNAVPICKCLEDKKIYYASKDRVEMRTNKSRIILSIDVGLEFNSYSLKFEDYGKTWALDRQTLEK